MIDVTTTAVLRPELLDQTYSSFKRLLFKDYPLRLIINVDRVGSDTTTVDDVIEVARKHFSNVLPLTQDRPNQNTALRAVWSNVESDLFFNLEDDWELLIDLDFEDMISVMREFPRLASLRLPLRESNATQCRVYQVCPSSWYFNWNGRYYEQPANDVGFFGGCPSLLRTAWMKTILPLIRATTPVEEMLRNQGKMKRPLSRNWDWGAYTKPNTSRTVITNGRGWRRKAGYKQDDPKRPSGWIKIDTTTN